MQRFHVAILVSVIVFGSGRMVSADEKDVQAILDKAVKALGGEDKLTKIEAAVWKGKGKMIIGDNQEHEFTSQTIAQGFDRFRSELEVEGVFGRQLRMLSVLNHDKVWLSVGVCQAHRSQGGAGGAGDGSAASRCFRRGLRGLA
jgi:hypothetical protein